MRKFKIAVTITVTVSPVDGPDKKASLSPFQVVSFNTGVVESPICVGIQPEEIKATSPVVTFGIVNLGARHLWKKSVSVTRQVSLSRTERTVVGTTASV